MSHRGLFATGSELTEELGVGGDGHGQDKAGGCTDEGITSFFG